MTDTGALALPIPDPTIATPPPSPTEVAQAQKEMRGKLQDFGIYGAPPEVTNDPALPLFLQMAEAAGSKVDLEKLSPEERAIHAHLRETYGDSQPAGATPKNGKQSEPTKAPVDAGQTAKELGAAKAALLRDGWPEAAIARLSDEEIRTVGEKRVAEQKRVDDQFKTLREKIRGDTTKDAEPTEETDADPGHVEAPGRTARPPQDKALVAAEKKIRETFAEHFGEDAGKEVATSTIGVLRDLVAPMQAQHQKLEQTIGVLADALEDVLASNIRQAWISSGDERVNDPEAWKQVRESYGDLAQTGKYRGMEGMREAYEHARLITLGPTPAGTTPAAQRAAEARLHADKASGRLAAPVRTGQETLSSGDRALFDLFAQFNGMQSAEG